MRAGWLHALALALASCGGQQEPASGWQAVDALELHGWLVDVTAHPAGDVWYAVGGVPERGVVLRGSPGADWNVEPTPETPLLNWAHVFADGTAWVVGNGGTALHFDGTGWRRHEVPTREDLWGVWGARPEDVWAVGGAGRSEGQATLLHYDGVVWQAVALPPLERPNVWALFKVWGTSANDVYAVGQRGAALHFDGQRWSELGLGTGEDLIALWGVGPDRIAAVGGRSSGVIATFDGVSWRSQSLAPLPGLNGVWMGDRDTVHVGGIDGTLAEVAFASLQYRAAYQDTDRTFHAVHGAGGRIVAVGGNLEATLPPYRGLARVRAWEAP